MGSDRQLQLRDVCELIVDCPHSTAKDEGEGYPLIRTPNIGRGYLDLDGVHRVSRDIYEKRNLRATPKPGDIILAREAPAGNAGIILEGQEVCLGQRTVLIRPDANVAHPLFMNYYLNAPQQRQYLTSSANGATVSHVNMSSIRALPVSLPDLSKQQRIAHVIGTIDALVRNNKAVNDYLHDLVMAASRSIYWEIEAADEALPDGWRWVEVDEIAELVSRGITPKYDEDSDETVLGQTCVRNNLVLVENGRLHKPKKVNEKWLREGDLLINSTGVGSLGRTAQVWFEPEKLTVDSHITIVRARKPEHALYLGFWAFAHERYIESLHTGSTGQTELPRDHVKAIRFVLPGAATLSWFNSIAEPVVKAIVANQDENKKLEALRDALLPKLMSGEIDVSKVELPA